MAASMFCSVAVVAVIVVCVPGPASVAAVTEMVYSVPALRPRKVWFRANPERRTSQFIKSLISDA